jgi:phosphoketolase
MRANVCLCSTASQARPCGSSPAWTAASTRTCTSLSFLFRPPVPLTPSASVLVGIGVEVTFEVVAAAALLRTLCPALRVRVVNVTDLMILSPERTHPHALTDDAFDALFTADRPVHFNFHGYVVELKGLLFGRRGLERVSIEGYREEGTTTSPFDVRRFPRCLN